MTVPQAAGVGASCTTYTSWSSPMPCFGDRAAGQLIELLDTAGSDDSESRDSELHLHMGSNFVSGGRVDAMMLVMKSTDNRLSASLKFTVKVRRRAMCVCVLHATSSPSRREAAIVTLVASNRKRPCNQLCSSGSALKLQALLNLFGPALWRHLVVVMTFKQWDEAPDEDAEWQECVTLWRRQFEVVYEEWKVEANDAGGAGVASAGGPGVVSATASRESLPSSVSPPPTMTEDSLAVPDFCITHDLPFIGVDCVQLAKAASKAKQSVGTLLASESGGASGPSPLPATLGDGPRVTISQLHALRAHFARLREVSRRDGGLTVTADRVRDLAARLSREVPSVPGYSHEEQAMHVGQPIYTMAPAGIVRAYCRPGAWAIAPAPEGAKSEDSLSTGVGQAGAPQWQAHAALAATGSTAAASPTSSDSNSAMCLPPGLHFDTSTGHIMGTPTAPFPRTTFAITAHNAAGWSNPTLVSMEVLPPPAPELVGPLDVHDHVTSARVRSMVESVHQCARATPEARVVFADVGSLEEAVVEAGLPHVAHPVLILQGADGALLNSERLEDLAGPVATLPAAESPLVAEVSRARQADAELCWTTNRSRQ